MSVYQEQKQSAATHEVFNQPPPLVDYNLLEQDAALLKMIQNSEARWALESLGSLGELAGSAEAIEWGFAANKYTPVLKTHDRFGHRIDEVEFHPAWHKLMEVAVKYGLHAAPWRTPQPGAHLARAASMYLWSQVESGHACPISMTYAGTPVICSQPELAEHWAGRLTNLNYEPELQPKYGKNSALCGMGMTEKQGGSDVRANSTRAVPVGSSRYGQEYRLTGHKWFCSAPMCDVFLVLAQAPSGLSCFLVPRVLPDGSRNRFAIQRLKDKLGNRSNASSEIEFNDSWAVPVGPEGRGVSTIIEMVNYTRLDCILSSAALMRQALAQASHHTAYRQAFGAKLIDQPLMLNVLADLAIESEAATILAMRLATACDKAGENSHEAQLKRLGTAVGKYWVTKRTPALVAEALECLGGNGYVEESIMPRLYREAPLNSIWEGSGNVNSLDVLRALSKESGALEAFLSEVGQAGGANVHLDKAVNRLKEELANRQNIEERARRLVEQMALVLQGALLVQHSTPEIADAFCVSRLGGDWGRAFGTLPAGLNFKTIVERARPKLS